MSYVYIAYLVFFVSKLIIFIFGIFLIIVGFIMLLSPKYARETLRKAGSTTFINYAELTLRMLPAFAMVILSEELKYSEFYRILGWFMIISSIALMIIPRRWHHSYALKCSEYLTPKIIPWISPISILFGAIVIYSVL